jgi:hypothetical protein
MADSHAASSAGQAARPVYLPEAAQYLGLAPIGCGTLALLISLWQYWWSNRQYDHGRQ